ncbi:hypothetical protein EON65_36700 [archaeon]|nr:MAG: hypothetical protein EON65_36700 [archaeon]
MIFEISEWLQSSTMHRNEIVYGSETRSLRIPRGFKEEPTGLHYKDGVLCACFPRSEEHESKKLQIESV